MYSTKMLYTPKLAGQCKKKLYAMYSKPESIHILFSPCADQ